MRRRPATLIYMYYRNKNKRAIIYLTKYLRCTIGRTPDGDLTSDDPIRMAIAFKSDFWRAIRDPERSGRRDRREVCTLIFRERVCIYTEFTFMIDIVPNRRLLTPDQRQLSSNAKDHVAILRRGRETTWLTIMTTKMILFALCKSRHLWRQVRQRERTSQATKYK